MPSTSKERTAWLSRMLLRFLDFPCLEALD